MGYRACAPKCTIFGARPQNLSIFCQKRYIELLQNIGKTILWGKSGARALQKYKIHPLKRTIFNARAPYPKTPYIPKTKHEILQNIGRNIHWWDKSSINIKRTIYGAKALYPNTFLYSVKGLCIPSKEPHENSPISYTYIHVIIMNSLCKIFPILYAYMHIIHTYHDLFVSNQIIHIFCQKSSVFRQKSPIKIILFYTHMIYILYVHIMISLCLIKSSIYSVKRALQKKKPDCRAQ